MIWILSKLRHLNDPPSICFERTTVLEIQAILILFHFFPITFTCSADPPLATAGVGTVHEVQFFSVIGDGSLVPGSRECAAEIHSCILVLSCRGQGAGRLSDSPLHTLTGAMEVCRKRSVTSGPVTFNHLYTGKCTNASVKCRGRACSFKATAWEGRDPLEPHSHRQKCETRTYIQIGCTGRFVCTHEHAKHLKLLQMEGGISSSSYIQAKKRIGSVFWVIINHSIQTLSDCLYVSSWNYTIIITRLPPNEGILVKRMFKLSDIHPSLYCRSCFF